MIAWLRKLLGLNRGPYPSPTSDQPLERITHPMWIGDTVYTLAMTFDPAEESILLENVGKAPPVKLYRYRPTWSAVLALAKWRFGDMVEVYYLEPIPESDASRLETWGLLAQTLLLYSYYKHPAEGNLIATQPKQRTEVTYVHPQGLNKDARVRYIRIDPKTLAVNPLELVRTSEGPINPHN